MLNSKVTRASVVFSLLIATLFTSLTLVPLAAFAGGGIGCIVGTVENHGTPVDNAEVKLLPKGASINQAAQTVYTDDDGYFYFCNVAPGDYTVVRNGFHLNKQYVNGMGKTVTMPADGHIDLTLDLPKILKPTTPASTNHHSAILKKNPSFEWQSLPEADYYMLTVVNDQAPYSIAFQSGKIFRNKFHLNNVLHENTPYYWILSAYDNAGRFVGSFGEFEHFKIAATAKNPQPQPQVQPQSQPQPQVNDDQASGTEVVANNDEETALELAAPNITAPAANAVLSAYPRKANLQWSNVFGAQVYEVIVECDTCNNASAWKNAEMKHIFTAHTSVNVTLPGDNQYRFKVRAWENGNIGPWSELRYFSFSTTLKMIKPLKPSFVGFISRLKEDCISFDLKNTYIGLSEDKYVISDGTKILEAFTNKDEAIKAMQTIQLFQFSKQCFVGRGNGEKPMEYWLSANNSAPAGTFVMPEDCVSFNPEKLSVEKKSAQNYTLVEKLSNGNEHMMITSTNLFDALKQKNVIKKYNFNQMCFVGRPDPSMTYFKTTAQIN